MKNDEINLRLKAMWKAIPDRAFFLQNVAADPIARELELLNMNMMTVWWMLSEIVLRMPEGE
jgi:hypothetical protein